MVLYSELNVDLESFDQKCSNAENFLSSKRIEPKMKFETFVKEFIVLNGELGSSKDVSSFCFDYLVYKSIKNFSPKFESEAELKKFLVKISKAIVGGEEGGLVQVYDKLYSFYIAGREIDGQGMDSKNIDIFETKMVHSSGVVEKNKSDIPYIHHGIWLTSPENPREINRNDIKNILYNKKFLYKQNQDWKCIIWTNDKELIKKSANLLSKHDVEVRSIYEIRDQIKLFDKIVELIDSDHFGMASDILRYEILFQQGGLYSDINFRFKNNLESYLKKYDFITEYTQNNFFISKPGSVILKKTIERIEDIFSNKPSYIDDLNEVNNTVAITHSPFMAAIIKFANTEGNTDFYHQYYSDFEIPYEGPLGQDNFSSQLTWMETV